MGDNSLSIRARKKYKAQVEKAARENHIAKFNKRMEVAKLGILSVKNKDYKSALLHFHAYIDYLQKSKGGGEITPKLFDPKQDSAEMLMLTGVFWDLAKIYDKFKTKDKNKLRYFLDKFILFSKGTSYEPLSREMLRKFLTNDNPNNRAIFKEAYVKVGGGRCFVATAVEEHCEVNTVKTLKRFRDEVLSKYIFGRAFTKIYYQVGPWIAIYLIRSSSFQQKRVAKLLGRIANAISFQFFQDER